MPIRPTTSFMPLMPHPQASAFRLLRCMLDLACLLVAWLAAAALLRYGFGPGEAALIAMAVGLRVALFWILGSYRLLLRYTGVHALLGLVLGVAAGSAALAVGSLTLGQPSAAFVCLEGLLALSLCVGNRLGVRIWHEWRSRARGVRTLIYGAGELGEVTCRSLRRGGRLCPVAFIDDDARKRGSIIHGRRIWGGLDQLAVVAKRFDAELLIVAVRDLTPEQLTLIFNSAMQAGIRVKQVVGIDAMAEGANTVAIGDINIEDLLRRPRRNLDPQIVPALVAGHTVLVTGAGGSIGSELCRQIAAQGAHRLILVDASEPSLYAIAREIEDTYRNVSVVEALLDVTWAEPVADLIAVERPAVVFHAAAYKHVPIVEGNPLAGVRNNVAGFLNVAQSCVAAGVPRLILISTDKAVRPTNVMGATKRVCELILQALPSGMTKLGAVRFGNVLGSSGSVIPRFLQQIAEGGPVTVTHPDITRFFMLIPEAVELVLQAGCLAEQHEVFILDMGEPVRIADMARQLIHLTGRVPDKDIAIVYTGLRPGEKLFEELLVDDAERQSAVDGITIARSAERSWDDVGTLVDDLLAACRSQDLPSLALALQKLVPEWTPGPTYVEALSTAGKRTSGQESGRWIAISG